MMPKTKEQFKQMRERSCIRILDAAFELFISQGYFDTTVEMIAKKAGMSKGLIYNYFDGKKDILRALLDKTFSEIQAPFPEIDSIQEPGEKLKYHIEKSISILKENEKFWKFHFQLMSQPATRPIIQEEIKKFLNTISKLVESIFRDLKVKNPVVEAMILDVILDGIMMRYVLSDGMFPTDLIKNRLIEMYCSKG